MKVNGSNYQVSFKAVTPIIAKKGGIQKLAKAIGEQPKGYDLQDATSWYKGGPIRGALSKAVSEGKEVGFLTTGPEYNKLMMMDTGWSGERAASRHIDRALAYVSETRKSVTKMLTKRINARDYKFK